MSISSWFSKENRIQFAYPDRKRKDFKMEKDPVCGMDVDPRTATNKSEYKGQTYYFCSSGCKKDFDHQPEKYIKLQEHSHHPH
jgi:YHS domain-containing protein